MTYKQKKIIFTATIAGVTLFTVYKVTREKKSKYSEITTPSQEEKIENPVGETKSEEKKVSKTIVEKAKEKATKVKLRIEAYVKKLVKFLAEHADELEGIKQAVTLAASIFTLKDVMQKSKMPEVGEKSPTPMITTEAVTKSFDIKTGDVLVGEWDTAGQYLHLSVV